MGGGRTDAADGCALGRGCEGKCKKCKLPGELLACSFCTNVYHNSDACLHEDKVLDTLAAQTRRSAWSRRVEASHASKDVVGMRAPKLVHQLSCLAAHLAHLASDVLPSAFPAHLTSDMLPFRRALHAVCEWHSCQACC